MSGYLSTPCTAFAGTRLLASGALVDVALAIRMSGALDGAAPVLVFDDATGKVVDLDLRGTTAEIVTRLTEHAALEELASATARKPAGDRAATPPRGRGRPRLGVVAREVTLLPRQWEWLATQPGGASQALRRLVDEARRADGGQTRRKAASEAAYRFLAALAGDLPGYEEALRALFARDAAAFAEHMHGWPSDIRGHALKLAAMVGDEETSGKDKPNKDPQ